MIELVSRRLRLLWLEPRREGDALILPDSYLEGWQHIHLRSCSGSQVEQVVIQAGSEEVGLVVVQFVEDLPLDALYLWELFQSYVYFSVF